MMTGVAVPHTTSMAELFEHSSRARPSYSTESMLNAAWSLAFEPITPTCAADGAVLLGAPRTQAGLSGCTGTDGAFVECLHLASLRFQMLRSGAGLCTACTAAAHAALVSSPSACPSGYHAELVGNTTLSSPSRTGLLAFDEVWLSSGGSDTPLCPGRYRIAVTIEGSDAIAHADIQVVDFGPDGPDSGTVTSEETTSLPAYTDPTDGSLVTSTTIIRRVATSDNVVTTIITNITTVITPGEAGASDNNTVSQASTAAWHPTGPTAPHRTHG